MFDPIFDSMRKAVETNVQFQHDLFKRWAALWTGMPGVPGVPAMPAMPGVPGVGSWAEQAQKFQKKWAEVVTEVTRQQRETLEEQLAAGMKQIEQAFHLAEIKDVDTLRTKTLELWQKTFLLLQQANEAQVRNFQTAVGKWTELMAPTA